MKMYGMVFIAFVLIFASCLICFGQDTETATDTAEAASGMSIEKIVEYILIGLGWIGAIAGWFGATKWKKVSTKIAVGVENFDEARKIATASGGEPEKSVKESIKEAAVSGGVEKVLNRLVNKLFSKKSS